MSIPPRLPSNYQSRPRYSQISSRSGDPMITRSRDFWISPDSHSFSRMMDNRFNPTQMSIQANAPNFSQLNSTPLRTPMNTAPRYPQMITQANSFHTPTRNPPVPINSDTSIFGKPVKTLGRGSYGVVFQSDQQLAVKKFLNHDSNKQPSKFINGETLIEIVCLKFLQPNPYIVELVGVDYQPNATFMAMELAMGTLDDLIQMDTYDFRDVALQIVESVAYCHRKDIIHRDIKPQNILLFAGNRVKLADFGLAKTTTCSTLDMTGYAYTPWYRAPEVSLGFPYAEPADVWAVACVLGEMIIKNPLFYDGSYERDRNLNTLFSNLGSPLQFYTDPSQAYRLWPNVQVSKYWDLSFGRYKATKFFNLFDKMPSAQKLIKRMLYFNPHDRIDIFTVLEDPFFNKNSHRVLCGRRNLDRILPNPDHSYDITGNIEIIYELTRSNTLPWKVAYDAIFYLDTWIANKGPIDVLPMTYICFNVACKLQSVPPIEASMILRYIPRTSVPLNELDLWELERQFLQLVDYKLILINAYDLIIKEDGDSWLMSKSLDILNREYPVARLLNPELVARQCLDLASEN